MMPLDIDPKLAWALKFRGSFPVDVNRAPARDAAARAGAGDARGRPDHRRAALAAAARSPMSARLTVSVAKVRPFLIASDWRPVALADKLDVRALVAPKVEQMELFG